MVTPVNLNIFIIPSKDESDPGVTRLHSLFYNHGAELVNAPLINILEPTVIEQLLVPENVDRDYMYVKYALDNTNAEDYIMIIKSTTVSAVESGSLFKALNQAVEGNITEDSEGYIKNKFDLLYLCKWMDRCDQYHDKESVLEDTGMKIVKTINPNGIQSIMITPEGAGKLRTFFNGREPLDYSISIYLTSLIRRGDLTAITFTPNIMLFDVEHATTFDYIKTRECADIPVPRKSLGDDASDLGLFWFVLIFIVVTVIVYFMVSYSIFQVYLQPLAYNRAT